MNQLSVIVFEIVSTGGPRTHMRRRTHNSGEKTFKYAKGANPFCIGIFGIETKILR